MVRDRRAGKPRGILYFILSQWEIYPILLVLGFWYSLMLDGSFWNDEVIYATSASNILRGHIFVNLEHPPLSKYMIALGVLALGETEFGARFPALLFGLGTLYVTYHSGKLMGSRAGGLLAAVFVGMTSAFATFATQAMLDIYLAFFTTLLFYLLLRFDRAWNEGMNEEKKRKWYLGLGIVAGLTMLTKFYALLFVMIALAILLWRARERKETEDMDGEKAKGLGDGTCGIKRSAGHVKPLAAFNKLYQFLIPRPYVKLMWAGFFGIILINYIPYLARPDLLVYYIVGWNSAHVAIGHSVMVGDTAYVYPPLWTYLYWIYASGFIYMAGLVISDVFLVRQLRAGKLRGPERLLFLYTFVPLLLLSILTVKSVRYMISLYPLLGLIAFVTLPGHISRLLKRLDDKRVILRDQTVIRRAAIACVIIALIIPPSPVYNVPRDPDFGIDSHYREASDLVADFADRYNNTTIEVVSFYHQSLNYYLERDHKDARNIHTVNLYYNSTELLDRFGNGEIHLVIGKTRNPRFEDSELYQIIHEDNLEKTKIGGDLSAYVMKYPY